mmetsp:Transcript_10127/g.23670  ORF Transcript_10127/g.23670 Transcript_10127/m.23670 type:complete len:227 (-) Transcript_10127:644-1324(-)
MLLPWSLIRTSEESVRTPAAKPTAPWRPISLFWRSRWRRLVQWESDAPSELASAGPIEHDPKSTVWRSGQYSRAARRCAAPPEKSLSARQRRRRFLHSTITWESASRPSSDMKLFVRSRCVSLVFAFITVARTSMPSSSNPLSLKSKCVSCVQVCRTLASAVVPSGPMSLLQRLRYSSCEKLQSTSASATTPDSSKALTPTFRCVIVVQFERACVSHMGPSSAMSF